MVVPSPRPSLRTTALNVVDEWGAMAGSGQTAPPPSSSTQPGIAVKSNITGLASCASTLNVADPDVNGLSYGFVIERVHAALSPVMFLLPAGAMFAGTIRGA